MESEVKHKINLDNMYDEDGFTDDYYTFLDKYSDEIKSGEISQECLDKMSGIVLDLKDTIENNIKFHIESIYVSIISIKYMPVKECGPLDLGRITQLIDSAHYLNNNNFYRLIGQENINRLCKEVFDELNDPKSAYYDITSKCGFIDEFKLYERIDARKYLDEFSEIGKRENDNDFLKELSRLYGGFSYGI